MRFRVERRDPLIGLPVGVVTQLVLVPLLYVPIFWIFGHKDLSDEARRSSPTAPRAPGIALLILLVVIGAPIVEELFFRGFLMGALERTMGPAWALWLSALFFGVVHFEPLQTAGPRAVRPRGGLARAAIRAARTGDLRPHGVQRGHDRDPARGPVLNP